ncbi:phosphoribosylamine--glycine ligase [Virgibacillus byunsanensis]|uniref:Phosphoribosylamine--glycine ligase n=1 Tax=Virgibacillus byunsanensis TaxID=570945 RepID=A0ABW3LIJ5_9BACI
MNILVVGRGGREHSMIMSLALSETIESLYAAPGNGGIASQANCVPISETDIDGLLAFAKEKAIDLTIIGPENPLLLGIANRFQDENLAIFAPTKEAALLEGSKSYAKAFMQKHGIPTADYASFTNADQAKKYIEKKGAPIVVKADGLASGKGVIVAETKVEALSAIDDMLVTKTFDEAGTTIVIEEFLAGKEFSLMAFVHENNVYPMVPARDHKRAYDNDEGPNTGGMGAFAPVPDVTEDLLAFATTEILQKTADGLMKEGRPFTGILYAGLMMTDDGPRVIEFNTRFGDPETQVVLPLLKNDLLQVFIDVMEGVNPKLQWEDSACVGVVVASIGYPAGYQKGVEIPELKPEGSSFTVHAGTKKLRTALVSDGGRVLLVGAKGSSLGEATNLAYRTLLPMKDSQAFFYRKDIGE